MINFQNKIKFEGCMLCVPFQISLTHKIELIIVVEIKKKLTTSYS